MISVFSSLEQCNNESDYLFGILKTIDTFYMLDKSEKEIRALLHNIFFFPNFQGTEKMEFSNT